MGRLVQHLSKIRVNCIQVVYKVKACLSLLENISFLCSMIKNTVPPSHAT